MLFASTSGSFLRKLTIVHKESMWRVFERSFLRRHARKVNSVLPIMTRACVNKFDCLSSACNRMWSRGGRQATVSLATLSEHNLAR